MTHNESLVLRFASGTDPGRRRQLNEDSAYASPRVLAVADGMGGHAHGEVASSIAVEVLSDLDRDLDPQRIDLLDALSDVVTEIGQRLANLGVRNPELKDMGTTLTTLVWDGTRFALAHVGDSRGYLLREGALHQLTRDHTLVQELVDAGRITEEQAAEHPRRSLLTQALRSGESPVPDLSYCEVRPFDRYLLCSDGVTAVLHAADIQEVLGTVPEPGDACRRLIELANAGGGPDNITCVVADVIDPAAFDEQDTVREPNWWQRLLGG
ncbi:protein phosphatase [Saccharopolyspora erythraea NRRL 2338]|uniref:Magnesium or manganese-dependent protein phosphatase n=1 Tax=Saccharopolyspora erythraea (strain ATCC 11635 / DSM 40517 / JCM 4748 / NBRC 13426 / NCIMB 8594 / NRRL 2338) TaxID=405948 RepID=A4FP04_SACEN|nr:protein phosphatase 2C domain-containing protein [Saccharopolyspora erythraea]EQD86543.1 protein phosphatase [Saccharopolyspora erythraea D]PFG99421.1 protein phosphatase [Saccharopolyspora erythraea NRRL 2338]QRK89333.1 serine/threonine-protein phosphatase [Saccharopolyspora erythraea]CAM05779.1 putative magnesium or manganese-dependent protein phosphatase [Saccharopolyspora erythraea NRRL 2338]